MFKVKNRNTRTTCEIRSMLTIKAPERHQWRCSSVFIVNFEHTSHLVLVFLFLTFSRYLHTTFGFNSFLPNVSFTSPRKHQKTKGFQGDQKKTLGRSELNQIIVAYWGYWKSNLKKKEKKKEEEEKVLLLLRFHRIDKIAVDLLTSYFIVIKKRKIYKIS